MPLLRSSTVPRFPPEFFPPRTEEAASPARAGGGAELIGRITRFELKYLLPPACYGALRLNALVDQLVSGRPVSQQPVLWALPLEPKLLIVYDRVPLVDPRHPRLRLTLDFDIRARFTGDPYEPLGLTDRLPLPVVME